MLFAGSLVAMPSFVLTNKAYGAWPKNSFDIKDLSESVSSVYGHNNLEESSKVKLKAPEIAENVLEEKDIKKIKILLNKE